MDESRHLSSAREHLARAEARYRSREGLVHLEEGLALLDEVIAGGSPDNRRVAQNLATTYSVKIYDRIRNLVVTDRGLPEPDLEHLFKVALAFDQCSVELPVETRSTRIELVRNLIDRYYEGHPPEAKRAALEQIADMTGKSKGNVRKRPTKRLTDRRGDGQ
jgi:hypothetical protein